MTAVEIIERVLGTKVLHPSLIYVPGRGASAEEIAAVASKLPRALSPAHQGLLRRWNGLNLEVIRIYGTVESREIQGLADNQDESLSEEPGMIIFADSPTGIAYAEDADGIIVSYDFDGGDVSALAPDFDDFFVRLVFGKDSAEFCGEDWRQQLAASGVTD
jgi:hypothetical protein